MSKRQTDVDERLVRRIASTYVEKFKKHGFPAAAEYAERILMGRPDLTERVREIVTSTMNPWSK